MESNPPFQLPVLPHLCLCSLEWDCIYGAEQADELPGVRMERGGGCMAVILSSSVGWLSETHAADQIGGSVGRMGGGKRKKKNRSKCAWLRELWGGRVPHPINRVFSSNVHKANAHYTHANVQILHAP